VATTVVDVDAEEEGVGGSSADVDIRPDAGTWENLEVALLEIDGAGAGEGGCPDFIAELEGEGGEGGEGLGVRSHRGWWRGHCFERVGRFWWCLFCFRVERAKLKLKKINGVRRSG